MSDDFSTKVNRHDPCLQLTDEQRRQIHNAFNRMFDDAFLHIINPMRHRKNLSEHGPPIRGFFDSLNKDMA